MWIFFLLLSSMLVGGEAVTATAAPGQTSQTAEAAEKTTITSKRMTVKNQESQAIFQGSVVLTRGPLVVHSDVMVVTFQSADGSGKESSKTAGRCGPTGGKSSGAGRASRDPKGGEGLPAVSNRSICLMEATGHVTIEKDDGRATGRKAVYYVTDRKIVLTGDPVACQRGTRVSGEKITMYIDEDRSEVEGGSQVLINPEGGPC